MIPAIGLASLAAGAFGVAAAAVEGVRRWTLRHGLLDTPGARSSHHVPTPTSGGIGIVLAVVGALAVIAAGDLTPVRPAAIIACAGLVMALIGLIDDARGLGAGLRLILQAAAASFVLLLIGHVPAIAFPGAGAIELGWLGAPLTLIWIVGMTNVFNFMDGIDGLAGSQAVIAGIVLAVAGASTGDALLCGAGTAIAAASAGFLLHNWPPARIFMGDAGSAFLGFLLGVLPAYASADPRVPAAAVLALWPFIFDAAFTLGRRLLRGENVFEAHRSHLYQRLTIAGYTHRQVTVRYAGLAAAGSAAALALMLRPALAWWLAAAIPFAAVWLWHSVVRAEEGLA